VRLWPRRKQHRRPRRPVAVYAWYDADDRPLYVGRSNDIGRRIEEHFWQAPWVHGATHMRVLGWHMDRAEAKVAERKAIKALRPGHNIQHAQPAPRVAQPPVPSPPPKTEPPVMLRDEAQRGFGRLLGEMAANGLIEVRMDDICDRWRHRSRPWVHRELARLADLGVVQKLPPEVPFTPARYRLTPVLIGAEGGVGGKDFPPARQPQMVWSGPLAAQPITNHPVASGVASEDRKRPHATPQATASDH